MTRFLLLIVLIAVVFYKLTGRRNARPAERESAPKASQEMVRCARCGMHLPADESFPGRGGAFCSAAHRAEFENGQA